ncbi:MAG TPA: aldose 1-epimerase [Baekduia sp.]|nr:aldose 1-epimerase [Baekduia sp.]
MSGERPGVEVRRGPWRALQLANDEIAVTLLPEKGCDIVELVHRETGIDVLFKAPWGWGRRPMHAASSFEAWIEANPGGWQVILPNGGDASVENGVEWGFHGEAGLVDWEVTDAGQDHAVCTTTLATVPLEIERVVRLEGSTLRVDERVTNAGGDPVEVMWGHHPAFGAPLLEPGCRIETSARRFTADDRAPGAGLEPGRVSPWPHAAVEGGGTIDLSVIPPADECRAVLGYLDDFAEGSYRIVNPRVPLAVEVRWPLELFPVAWYWQELRASSGFPWYRRAYTTAIEPNTTMPGQGIARARAAGAALLELSAGESRTATVEADLLRP